MTLCLNCLEETTQRPTPVGHDIGSQRDPNYRTVQLCEVCSDALVDGHFDVLHERYNQERTIRR